MNKWTEINLLLERVDDEELNFYLNDWIRLKKLELRKGCVEK